MLTQTASRPFSILFVDDEAQAVKYFQRAFLGRFDVLTATSADEAQAILEKIDSNVAVLITDQRMPGRTGVSLLKFARERHPYIIRIITTAYADLDSAIDAVNTGEIFRYITKPWDLRLLEAELAHAIEFFNLRREHQLLLREKIAVMQKLVLRDRVFSLAATAARLPKARNAIASVYSYLKGALSDPTVRSQFVKLWSVVPQREHWRLPASECQRTIALADELAAIDFPSRIDVKPVMADLNAWLGGDTSSFERKYEGPESPFIETTNAEVVRDLVGYMKSRVLSWSREGAKKSISLTVTPDYEGRPQFQAVASTADLKLEAFLADSALFATPLAQGGGAGQALRAVLLAGHAGGQLSIKLTAERGATIDFTVPAIDPQISAPPTSGWLDEVLNHYDAFVAASFDYPGA